MTMLLEISPFYQFILLFPWSCLNIFFYPKNEGVSKLLQAKIEVIICGFVLILTAI